MSQHGCYVPTSFYNHVTRDACAFADKYCDGKVVSVLEGGYSNRALISGVMAHVSGLAEYGSVAANPEWWDTQELEQVCLVQFNHISSSAVN